MGNINFELPCADRKTREKKFLNKYDRKSIFNTNNDLPPRNTKQLNELEKYINFHETQRKKNSYIIENAKFHSGIGLNNDPSSTFDSNTNDNEGLKVSYVMEYSITELLNKSLKMNKNSFIPTFIFPNPTKPNQTVIIYQHLDIIANIEVNCNEKYRYEEKRINLLEEPNISYVDLKKFFNQEGINSEYIGYHHNPKNLSEYVFIFLKVIKQNEFQEEKSKDSLNETHFEMQSINLENLNSQDIMLTISERAKSELVFKGIINLLGKSKANKNLNVLLFGKSKNENIEYILHQISYDEGEENIINEEVCKKIYFSCEADGLALFGFVPLMEEQKLYILLGREK